MGVLQIPSAGWGLLVFTLQYIAGIIVFSTVRPWQSIASPWELIAVTIVIAGANSVVIVEGVKMLAESFLREREKLGEKRGEKLGEKRGREEAVKEFTRAFDKYVESLKVKGFELPPRPSLFEVKDDEAN